MYEPYMVKIQSIVLYIKIFFVKFLWLNEREKPAVTGIGCMKKVKAITKIIKKDRDIEERAILAIPSLCEFIAETQSLLIYNFCFILTKPKFCFSLSFQWNFPQKTKSIYNDDKGNTFW